MMNIVSVRTPMDRKNAAITDRTRIRTSLERSSSISVMSSSRRVCNSAIAFPVSLRSAASTPWSGDASGRGSSTFGLSASATADQTTDHESDACGDPNRFPGIVVDIFVGVAGGLLALVDEDFFGLGELDLRPTQAFLYLLPGHRDFLTSLGGGCTKQFLRVGNDNLEILHELFLGDGVVGVHGIPQFS